MAVITAGQGQGTQNSANTSNNYTYVERGGPCDGSGLITQIKAQIQVNGGTLKIGCAAVNGTTITPRNYVTIDISGDGTGWKTYNAPADFTAFQIVAGDLIIIQCNSTGFATLARSSSGGVNLYGYISGDHFDDVSFVMSTVASRWVECELIGSDTTYKLEGVSKDKNGNTLGNCECYLFKDNQDNTLSFIGHDQSDASGNYSFTGIVDNVAQYLVIAWKDNTPHVFDVTDHVLTPVAE